MEQEAEQKISGEKKSKRSAVVEIQLGLIL